MTKSVSTRDYAEFCRLLAKTRKEAGLTQVELAEKLNRPQSYVSKYECGERRLDVIEFLEVAEGVGFDPAALVATIQRRGSE